MYNLYLTYLQFRERNILRKKCILTLVKVSLKSEYSRVVLVGKGGVGVGVGGGWGVVALAGAEVVGTAVAGESWGVVELAVGGWATSAVSLAANVWLGVGAGGVVVALLARPAVMMAEV